MINEKILETLDKEIARLEQSVIINNRNDKINDYWAGHCEGLLAGFRYIRELISKGE